MNRKQITNSKCSVRPKTYYLIGALKDGCLTSQWTIKIKQKNKQWLTSVIIPIFTEVFNRKFVNNVYLQKSRTPVWYLAFKSKAIWTTLNLLTKQIPKTKEEQKFYLMGFWDADGGCPKNPVASKKIYIKFTQKDRKSLDELKQILEDRFGISCGNIRISEKVKDGVIWRFSITNRKGILKFCKEIGSLHPEKKLRLNKIIEILSAR